MKIKKNNFSTLVFENPKKSKIRLPLLDRYGVWLLVGLCMPRGQDPAQEMTGLLSMLFEWYKVTATLPNDKSGAVVEKIKSDYIPPWLRFVE
jgi:hypothetical protein